MSIINFILISMLYSSIGMFTFIGVMSVTNKIFNGAASRTFYSIIMVVIAALYILFITPAQGSQPWITELVVIVIFSLLAVVGSYNTNVLIAVYFSHGIWDLIHELSQTNLLNQFHFTSLTTIPVGYGFFCLTFDFLIAAYFLSIRKQWL